MPNILFTLNDDLSATEDSQGVDYQIESMITKTNTNKQVIEQIKLYSLSRFFQKHYFYEDDREEPACSRQGGNYENQHLSVCARDVPFCSNK